MATVLGGKQIGQKVLEEIREKATQWALIHGVQMRPAVNPTSTLTCEHAPMTLFPSLVPMAILQEAKSLQKHYNTLMHKVAYDHQFLEKSLQNVVKVDDFTRNLWRIYTTVKEEGLVQPVSLGLFRNDFMMDIKESCCRVKGIPQQIDLKQIEFNTIAASFGGLASAMWQVHRYTLALSDIDYTEQQLPVNTPCRGLAKGLLRAWELYNNESAVVVCINQESERNTIDQKWVEKELFLANRNVRMIYLTFQEAGQKTSLSADKSLVLDDGREIAVIYFRSGYMPNSYPTEKEWDIRLRMERSRAIKCPSVQYQLAGCKKIQQELAAPGVLERFFTDPDMVARLRGTFAGQYSLDLGPEGDEAVAMAMENPQKFVLKPQREGGGNNMYGDDIKDYLRRIRDTEERNAFILMERIFPWKQNNYLMKVGREFRLAEVISEIGIYGVYLGSANTEEHNEVVGHLLRTKHSEDNEGGIMSGFATIDSPFLI